MATSSSSSDDGVKNAVFCFVEKKYVNEQGEVVQDIMSEEVKSRYEKRKTEDQNVSEDKI